VGIRVLAVLNSPFVLSRNEQETFGVEYDPQAGRYTAMLTVRGAVTFREAPELRRQLLRAIEAHPDRNLVVELGQVTQFDTAAMAVLLEGLKLTNGVEPEVFLVGASESVTKVFNLAGFEDALLRCFGCMDDIHRQIAS
jgi:anti-anti-sigma factor